MQEIADTIKSYLSFELNKEIFAVNVSKVLEILEIREITKIPHSPNYLRGVINLRGKVLPVIETREKFGLPSGEDTVDTCIIVLDVLVEGEPIHLGILVDAVSEVLEIEKNEVEPSPSLGSKFKSEFICGMYRREERFIMLLDIDQIFSSDEAVLLKKHTQEDEEVKE